ncbi:MAG: phage terminase small subunit-related protein [Defluviitaleaceae bacterium]|nr:phage terminase small subunit-related protein [Defluviitaleaceae bacterium]
MPRPRSPERDEAYVIFEKHNGKIENRRIAEQIGKDERFIAKWKHEDDWLDKLKKNKGVHHSPKSVHQTAERCTPNDAAKKPTNNSPKKKTPHPPRSRPDGENPETTRHPQARPGNKNAVGNDGGAPTGNKNAVRTGEYETILYGNLTDEERELLSAPLDVVAELENSLLFERVRIRRMNKRVMAAENAPGGMVIDNVVKVQGATVGRTPIGTQTTADAAVNRADRLENSLTRVITGVRKGLSELHRMKSASADTAIADDWMGGFDDDEA